MSNQSSRSFLDLGPKSKIPRIYVAFLNRLDLLGATFNLAACNPLGGFRFFLFLQSSVDKRGEMDVPQKNTIWLHVFGNPPPKNVQASLETFFWPLVPRE